MLNNKLILLLTYLLLTLSGICLGQNSNDGSSPPNIIIIIPDDMGWHDIGYHGSVIKTPNLDQLARSGVILNQHYVMPTCTPTRVSLMTGLYPSRYGITGPDYGEVIDRGDPTLASLLAESGYTTHIAGKWHMGSPPHTPLKYGFDTSYGFFDGQIDPYTHEYKTETELTSRQSWHRNDDYLNEEGHATDLITNEAIRIIKEEHEQPFFIYLAYSVPHIPLDEPDHWTSRYDGLNMHPSRKWFAASISHMDDRIGKVVNALEESGKRENTIILFISDNGGQKNWRSQTLYRGAYADKPHDVLGNNFPLRGWKGDLFEGGIRVPAFINWPGRLPADELDMPVHVSDWLPTLCQLAGTEVANINLDGENIWPYLANEQEAKDRKLYWKTRQHFAVRDGDWKMLLQTDNSDTLLYDLSEDFRETRDLSQLHPEKIIQLMQLLEDFRANDREE